MAKSKLIASAGSKEELQKLVNDYYFSENCRILENNEIYNIKLDRVLPGVKVEFNRNRWRFVFE